jgi:Ku70/Ku80 beta-barrel domain
MAGVIRMKTMMAAVIDIGPTMNSSPLKNGERSASSKLAIAKHFLACYIVQKMMAIKTAEFGLVMNGDDYTNNHLNTTQGGGYERINELYSMSRASADIIEIINNISCGSAPGDAIDGIVVGFDILDRTNVGKAYNKVLLFITDGETVIEGLEDLGPIVANMKEKECAVYVLFLGKIDDTSSSIKVQNAGVLSDIAASTFGRFCEANDLADCFPLLTSAPGLSTKPRQQRFVFEISPYMRVPCVTWNKTKSISLPSLKKAPKVQSGGDDSIISTVKTDLTYRNPVDEDEEVSMVDRIKGYKYGAQYIPIQEDEERAFRVPGVQGIVLIGFVAQSAVPRHHYMQKAVVFEGNPEIDCAVNTVRALYHAMQTTRTVALVRFVSKENADPYLGALIPNTAEKDEASSFILHRLPVAEDIREYAFHSFNLSTLQSLQNESVASFIDTMLVPNPLPSQLHPFNPTKVEIVLELQKRFLSQRGADFEIPSFREPLQPVLVGKRWCNTEFLIYVISIYSPSIQLQVLFVPYTS